MEPLFGHDFSTVRIHTDSKAAESARSVGALAYTTGNDVVFGAGMYAPSSLDGRRLIAHELTHVVQQTETGPTPGASSLQFKRSANDAAERVQGVTLSCEDMRIQFETSEARYTYSLETCDLTEGEYDAAVAVTGDDVNFDLGNNVGAGIRFEFSYRVEPGQTNPARLFEKQDRVHVVATLGPLARSGLRTREVAARTSLSIRLAEFKRLVRNAGQVRLAQNQRALEQWREFLRTKLSPENVQHQVHALEAHRLLMTAEHGGARERETAELWLQTHGPNRRWVLEQQIEGRYRACTGCHALVRADELDFQLESIRGKEVESPASRLANAAQSESAAPDSLLTEFAGSASKSGGLPEWAIINNGSLYPTVSETSKNLEAIGPYLYLRVLGPDGYRVLPQETLGEDRSSDELLHEINTRIDERISDYTKLSTRIGEPGFDYLDLRPIVRELLPVADADVRVLVEREIENAETWETVKSVVIGTATLALLLMIIFPPASAAGVAGGVALVGALSAEQVYSGIRSYQQGRLYALGRGAHDVLDPDQQHAADMLVAMGMLNTVLGVVDLAGVSLASVKLLRLRRGSQLSGTLGPLESIEARAGDNIVRIEGLDTSDPRVRVFGKDGRLVHERSAASLAGPPSKGKAGQLDPDTVNRWIEDEIASLRASDSPGSRTATPDTSSTTPIQAATFEEALAKVDMTGADIDALRAGWARYKKREGPNASLGSERDYARFVWGKRSGQLKDFKPPRELGVPGAVEQEAGHVLERVVNNRLPRGSSNSKDIPTPHGNRRPDHLPPGARTVYLNKDGTLSRTPTDSSFSARFVGDSKYRDSIPTSDQTRGFVHLAALSDSRQLVFYVRWRDSFPSVNTVNFDASIGGRVLPQSFAESIVGKGVRELADKAGVQIRLVSDPRWR